MKIWLVILQRIPAFHEHLQTIIHYFALFFRERSDEDLEEYYRRKYVETSRKYVLILD
jgi:hypothetical protein